MSRFNPFLWPRLPLIWRYVLPFFLVGVSLLIAQSPESPLQAAPVSVFICAVMVSAWFGGLGPGLVATLLSTLSFVYFFLLPSRSFALAPHEIPRFVFFVMTTLFVALVTAAQRNAAESLRQSRDELSLTVQGLRKSEEKIRQDERELRQIIDLVPEHIIVSAPDGSRLYANQVVLQYYGIGMEELVSADFPSRALHPDDVERIVRERGASLARGVAYEQEARARRKDGQFRWFLVRFTPVCDDRGHILHWYITGTDIEARKQAEERLQLENVALREEIDSTSMFEEIVGSSPALQSLLSQVAKVAPTETTVLITGETGTGKELIARAIHKRSERSSRSFVGVNCAAIPRDLIASELFGHEKGAFTGATQRRIGRFELAQGGTIFLDEVGELPPETQISLLRVLQEREYERVGGTRPITADVRVVAATNRDLQGAISAGAFRSDLFYRLNVFPLEVPPLRQRKEDIPILVQYFIERYASKVGKKISGIGKSTLELLQSYAWPGNIRELQNVIERSVIVCDSENFSVDESWLSTRPAQADPDIQPLSQKLATQEKEMIEAALAESKGRVSGPSGAAAKLGIPQSTLDSKIKSLKIDKQRFRTS
jgi:formate hydrogenlyase transcriptional activator